MHRNYGRSDTPAPFKAFGHAFRAARLLIVDDDAANVRSFTRLLQQAGIGRIISTNDAREALDLAREHDPDLVVLDLHMPDLSGVDLLPQLRTQPVAHSFVPVLVITGDSSSEARRDALSAGATDFLTKPYDIHEALLRIRNLLEIRRLHRALAEHNQVLEQRVRDRTVELEAAQLDTLERLALAAEFRDDDTGRHTERVGRISELLARALGLPEPEAALLRLAAPLHDVGKIAVPDAILRKPTALTPEESAIMRSHTTIGARILSGGRSALLQQAQQIALLHHERWDGTGYPEARAGEKIPLVARIVAVADFFDACTSDRVYRPAWSADKVLAEIATQAGRHFDPKLAAVCWDPAVKKELKSIRRDEVPRRVQKRA